MQEKIRHPKKNFCIFSLILKTCLRTENVVKLNQISCPSLKLFPDTDSLLSLVLSAKIE